MGIPGCHPYEAIERFAAIGFTGIELVCRDGTQFDSSHDRAQASRTADYAESYGLPVAALTPYAADVNSADPIVARAALKEMRDTIDLAHIMRARFVRAYGGRDLTDDREGGFERAVDALRTIGVHAARFGITVVVENHPGTMTRTGAATRRLIDQIALPTVRALYDPANTLHDTDEPWEETLETQLGTIAYVHVKDFGDHSGKRRACNVGDGVVPWPTILERLLAAGYDGPLSFEYEKMWYPDDLAEAEDGMAKSMTVVKKMCGDQT